MPQWDIHFTPNIDTRDKDILQLSVQIEAFKLSISKIPLPPGIRQNVDRLNIVRQIKGTTGIEGNTLTEEEIDRLIEHREEHADNSNDEREALNSIAVHEYILQVVSTRKSTYLSEELIKEIHRITTQGLEYENNVPGQYRQHRAIAGSYLTPDHSEVPRLMEQFVEFINHPSVAQGCGPIIRAILAHFYLVSIHPFGDGNGRTSRAIEAFILRTAGYNVHGFYSLANFYYRNRARYISELQDARFKFNGDLRQFVLFSMGGFVEELFRVQDEILDFVRSLMFRDYVDELFGKDAISSRIRAFISYLVKDRGIISVDEYRTRRHYVLEMMYENCKSQRTQLRDLQKMQELRLITIDSKGQILPNIELMNDFV